MTRRPRVRWRARERTVSERGLVFFGRRRLTLADDIDIESPGAEARLLELLLPPAPAGGWAAVDLWLVPSGHDRPPFRHLRGRHDPREAFVRCEARPGGDSRADDVDVVEARVRWETGTGTPRLLERHHQPGRLSRARASRPLRERLDAAARALRAAELVWRAPDGPTLWLRADRALYALGDRLDRLDEQARAELEQLCSRLGHEGAELALTEPAQRLPDTWRWLPALAGRRRSLRPALLRGHCPACDAIHPGDAWREEPYDRRAEVAGDSGLLLHCPGGHALRVCLD